MQLFEVVFVCKSVPDGDEKEVNARPIVPVVLPNVETGAADEHPDEQKRERPTHCNGTCTLLARTLLTPPNVLLQSCRVHCCASLVIH